MSKANGVVICGLILLVAALTPAVGEAQAAERDGPGRNTIPDRVELVLSQESRGVQVLGIPWNDTRHSFAKSNRRVFSRFLETHPHIKPVPTQGARLTGPENDSHILMAIAAGNAPYVFYLNSHQLQRYVEQNLVMPLDDFIQESNWKPYRKLPPALPDATRYGGKVYALPHSYTTYALVYRKDLFEKAGISGPPETWDELFEYARKLSQKRATLTKGWQKEKEFDVWGLQIRVGHSAAFYFAPFVWQAGGDMIRETPDGWRVGFDSPGGVEALKFYQRLRWTPWERDDVRYKGVVYVCDQTLQPEQSLRRGFVAMDIANPLDYTKFEAAAGLGMREIGIAPLPAGPAGSAGIMKARFLAINSQIKDEAQRRAAWEFIEFMCSEEAARVRTETFVRLGQPHILHPDDLKMFGYEDYYEDLDPEWRAMYEKVEKVARLEPHVPGYEVISTSELRAPIEKVLLAGPNVDPEAELKRCAERANSIILGEQDPAKRRLFIVMACTVLVGGIAGSIYAVRKYMATIVKTSSPARAGRYTFARHRTTMVTGLLLLLPAAALIIVWSYVPMVRGLKIAFFDYRLFGESEFVGLKNFIDIFSQPSFWRVLLTTVKFVGLSIGLGFLVPIMVAILLSEVPRGKYAFRTIYYLPAVVSPVVMLMLWKSMIFLPADTGWLNQILLGTVNPAGEFLGNAIGLGRPLFQIDYLKWFLDPRLAMFCIIIPGIWAHAGPGSIIYIAALRSIPDAHYQAAEVDGAGFFRKLRYVAIPFLSPLIMINFIGAFIGGFRAAQNILIMTEGGPMNATRTLALEIFYDAFVYMKYGYATAMGWVMGAMLIGFTVWNIRILSKVQFSRAG